MSMTDDDALFMTIQPGSDNAGQPLEDFFDAFYGKRQLCASERPLRDAAITLIELGAPPDMTKALRRLCPELAPRIRDGSLELDAAQEEVGKAFDKLVMAEMSPPPDGGGAS